MTTAEIENNIREVFEKNGLRDLLKSGMTEKLAALTEILISENKKYNLTAIDDPEGIVLKHLCDSATVARYIPENAKVLDVGTGAGFPAIPIAVLRPDCKVYALDSTAKKLRFVELASESLGLDNVKTVEGRAEEIARSVNYRERFDFVTARAVAGLNVLTELCMPFVKVDGTFAAMKGGAAADGEIAQAKRGISQLGGQRFTEVSLTLESDSETVSRKLVFSKKDSQTPPTFPRKYSVISKRPL